MAKNTVAFRWEWKRDELLLTQIKSSPRGTRYLGASLSLKRPFKDKETQTTAIKEALDKLMAP